MQSQMMIVLLHIPGHLRDLLKAQILLMWLCERKHNVNKVTAHPRDVGDALSFRSDTNHRLRRDGLYLPNSRKLFNEVMQQRHRLRWLTSHKFFQ